MGHLHVQQHPAFGVVSETVGLVVLPWRLVLHEDLPRCELSLHGPGLGCRHDGGHIQVGGSVCDSR